MKLLHLSLLLLVVACASNFKDKTVIAHRGAPGYLPEHSLEGVAMAHGWGVDFIEPDLVVTKDNRLVVLHDTHIDTTTNVAKIFPHKKRKDGRYYAVDFTLKELKKLKLNERIDLKTGKRVFPNRFPLDHSKFEIPTVEEFIELIQGLNHTTGKNIGIYPELKSPEFHKKEGKDIAKLFVTVLNKYGYNKKDANIYVQCFYYPTLVRLRNELGVKAPLILLIAENSWAESTLDYKYYQTPEGIKEISSVVNGIGPYLMQVISYRNQHPEDSGLVSLAHKYNLKVHPYTHRSDQLPPGFNSDEKLLKFIFDQLQVDGIFSDFADKVINLKYRKN